MSGERIQNASEMLSASWWNFSLLSRKAFSACLRSVMTLADGTREIDLAGLVPQRLNGEVDVDELVLRHAHLHVVAGGLPARGPRDRLTQLLLDVPGIGPPVGFLEGLAEDVFRLQTGRGQRRPVGLDQDSLGCHQSHEHGWAKSIDEIAQALLTPLRRLLADVQFVLGLRNSSSAARRARTSSAGVRSTSSAGVLRLSFIRGECRKGSYPFSSSGEKGYDPFSPSQLDDGRSQNRRLFSSRHLPPLADLRPFEFEVGDQRPGRFGRQTAVAED